MSSSLLIRRSPPPSAFVCRPLLCGRASASSFGLRHALPIAARHADVDGRTGTIHWIRANISSVALALFGVCALLFFYEQSVGSWDTILFWGAEALSEGMLPPY
jgi:hypothetical protein